MFITDALDNLHGRLLRHEESARLLVAYIERVVHSPEFREVEADLSAFMKAAMHKARVRLHAIGMLVDTYLLVHERRRANKLAGRHGKNILERQMMREMTRELDEIRSLLNSASPYMDSNFDEATIRALGGVAVAGFMAQGPRDYEHFDGGTIIRTAGTKSADSQDMADQFDTATEHKLREEFEAGGNP